MEQIIKHFNMIPHPEGGFYVESYRSQLSFQTDRGTRSASTAIYFLLPHGQVSHLHRLKSDETWHFYMGDVLTIIIFDGGEIRKIKLGSDYEGGQVFQAVVEAGSWFGALIEEEEEGGGECFGYSLVGCTVAPGFEFADFELAKFKDLNIVASSNLLRKLCIQ
jgi:predicted cupin superfamily sugar epimerase